MNAIKFPGMTTVVAKNQKPYTQLPAHIDDIDPAGPVTTCWKMSFGERLKVLFTGRVWMQMLCFHAPVTPSRLSVDKPHMAKWQDTESPTKKFGHASL